MTWTLVQKSASYATSGTGTVTGTLPGGSTANNLLVACLGSNVAGTQFTGPAGWLQAAQTGNGSLSRAELWYLPLASNGGGITTAAFTCGTGQVRAALAEFHTDVTSPSVSVDSAATGTASTVTSCTTGSFSTSASGDLVVCSFLEHLGSNSALTWTDPSGFTLLDSMTASASNQAYSAYLLSAAGPASGLTVTGTSNVAAGTSGWTGCAVACTATGAASQTVFVGSTINTNDYPPGTTRPQASRLFEAATGRTNQIQKLYYILGPVLASGQVNLADHDIATWIARGQKCLLCFSPAFKSLSQSDYSNLNTTCAAYKAAGLIAEVAFWQEPSNANKNLSPAQYGAMVLFYKGAVTPYYPLVASLNYSGAGGDPQNFLNYFNSVPAGTFSKAYMDFYAREFAARNPADLNGPIAACDAQGIPFGIAEWGCNPQIDGIQTSIDFMNYVASAPTSVMQTRKTAGSLISDLIWYNGPGPGNALALPITDPPQAGCTLPGQSKDFRIPYYQQAFDALNSTVTTTTVTIAATLTVLATPSAAAAVGGVTQVTFAATLEAGASITATLSGGTPVVVPAAPPGVPSAGLPQIITQLGVLPAQPVAALGTFILNDTTFGILNQDILGQATNWADISTDVRSFTITRTSTRQNAPVITYDAGTDVIVLANAAGAYDPNNLAGPFTAAGQTQIRPMVPVRQIAAWNNVQYPLYSGFADSWITPDTNFGPQYSETTLSATDAFKVLTGFQLGATAASLNAGNQLPAGGGEDTGARVTRLLNLAGWDSGNRLIDTGNTTQQGTSLAGPDALTEMQLSIDTELGELYVNGEGSVVFRRRHGVMEDPRSTVPQAIFGDQPGPAQQLNINTGFETDTAGWAAVNGASITKSGSQAFAGSFCCLVIAGAGANPGMITSPNAPVSAAAYVTFSAWLIAATGVPAQMSLTLQFYGKHGGHLAAQDVTTTLQTQAFWAQAVVSASAPAAAVSVAGLITITGANPATQGVDEAYLLVAPELPYSNLGRADDDTQLCNDCQITAAGSANLQEAQDANSIATFLYPRSYARTDLLLGSDLEALETAQFLVYISKGAENRFDTLTLSPMRDPADLFPQALGREIGDMVAVIRRPPGVAPITKQLIIRGITHTVDISSNSWQTQWMLQDAARYAFFNLNDPTAGQLDNNPLAY